MEKTIDQLRFVGLSGGEWPTYYDEESRRYHVDLCGAIGLSEPFWFGSDEEAYLMDFSRPSNSWIH